MRKPKRAGAVARITGGREAPMLRGTMKFYPVWGGTLVVASVQGLPANENGIFALHIHQGGNCGGVDFTSAGAHYDPSAMPHPSHAGDLPPLLRCCSGQAFFAVLTSRFRIPDVIGKTVIIHSGPDDFRTQPAGNSGKRIACGVIRKS